MAILDLIIPGNDIFKLQFAEIEGVAVLRFDVIKEVKHMMNSQLTKNKIEDGSDITDHVNLSNKKSVFSIGITDTPLIGGIGNIAKGVAATAAADKIRILPTELLILQASGVSRISGGILDKSNIRSQETFDLLKNLRNNKVLITASLGFETYNNAIISNLSITQNFNNKGFLEANITIEEIVFASTLSENVKVNNVDKDVEHTATTKVNEGKQNSKEVSEEITENASVLYNLIGTQ
jgi:hypothetical protein